MHMTVLLQLFIFWSLSSLGYLAARHLRVPAPAILGPIAVMAILSILGIEIRAPGFQKPVLSLITGIFLGIRMNRSFRGVKKQVFVYIIWIIFLSFSGMMILMLLGLDKNTAFFSSLPGGMAEITLMSLGYDLDHVAIVILQTSRMLIPMTVFSAIAATYYEKQKQTAEDTDEIIKKSNIADSNMPEKSKKVSVSVWIVMITVSIVGTYILNIVKVPLANLLAPMLSVGSILRREAYRVKINKKLQIIVQIGIGGLTGAALDREGIVHFHHYIIPVVVLCLFVILAGILMSKILKYITNWDTLTCILCCCPAGSSPIIMIAMEYGADANIVMLFQVLRMITVLVAAPILIQLLL